MTPPYLPDRYKILGVLGQGGEGCVYRVHDYLRASDLALKVAPPDLSDWLRREFETLRQIRHENLIKVFDCGLTETSEAFYTMELVIGSDWGTRMGKPQSHDEVVPILYGLLRGLAHLHSHGEVHGDIKPSNVLLSNHGLVKVADIGMGQVANREQLSGTPGYSAPELWTGSGCDVRSDIYSVGVMAYEALTGRHPFQGKTIREVVSGQLIGWVASPAALGVRLPGDLERGIMRTLERDPALRPASADELMELLGEDDRIGSIMGGRFVARSSELAQIESMLESAGPESPTLIWVGGEGGVGKTALIEEMTNRALKRDLRVARVVEMEELGEFRSSSAPTFAESERVWESAMQHPVILTLELSDGEIDATSAGIRALTRHLHAIACERGVPSGARVIVETHEKVGSTEPFEKLLLLQPFANEETGLFLRAYLGNVSLQPEIVAWLTVVTGGVPGRLSSVIDELVEKQLLRRRGGRWHFKESEALPSIEGSLKRGKREQSWEQLDDAEQSMLALLSLFPRGLSLEILEKAIPGVASDSIDSLLAEGWLREVGSRLQPASGEARRVASLANRELTAAFETTLLEVFPDQLTREERALLLLRNSVSVEALREGLWAASDAMARGDLRATVDRGKACRDIAVRLQDNKSREKAELILGQALHLLGSNDEAMGLLRRDGGQESAAREQLLGMISRSQGNLKAARRYLGSAIALAENDEDSAVYLRSHAELAEVDWRHGDERARDAAIHRVRAALSSKAAASGTANDRASLAYQLGSALIIAGKRDEAVSVLENGLALSPDDFWTMRIATALAAATYYLGEFESALRWIDEAWGRAERGGFDLFKARIFFNRASIHYGLGKFREAVEYDRLSSIWARRSGQEFEYLVACANEASILLILGEYESVLKRSNEVKEIARRLGNDFQVMKSVETEALCRLLIGDYSQAAALADEILHLSNQFGQSDMAPRALLLKGMLAENGCNWNDARDQLSKAEGMLRDTRDWEDLPAVQIELEWIRAQEDPRSALDSIAVIVKGLAKAGALTVQLRGALVLGEILLAAGIDDVEHRDAMLTALGKAGEAGAAEDEWRLNHVLGELYLRRGDRKSAAARFSQSLRGLRSIADRLSADHRRHYLRTPHASRLLTRVS